MRVYAIGLGNVEGSRVYSVLGKLPCMFEKFHVLVDHPEIVCAGVSGNFVLPPGSASWCVVSSSDLFNRNIWRGTENSRVTGTDTQQDMTVCRAIYAEPHRSLRASGLNYQVRLLRAIKAGERERSRSIMLEHMVAAEEYMLDRAEIRARSPGKEMNP